MLGAYVRRSIFQQRKKNTLQASTSYLMVQEAVLQVTSSHLLDRASYDRSHQILQTAVENILSKLQRAIQVRREFSF